MSPAQTRVGTSWTTLVPFVDPLKLKCRKCGAEPGQFCKRWSNRHQLFCRKKSSPHEERKHDARLGSQMLSALNI
jgi:hypothetical protein